jgi:hypothetical protein
MSHVAKLSLAVGLAFAAALLNAMWLTAAKRPPTFVAVSTDVSAGQDISDDALMEVPVPGDPEKLREALIPYSNRAILFGRKSPRNYARGDVLFYRDIQPPTEPAKFEVVGPFRLMYVGDRFKQTSSDQKEDRIDPGGNNVTIAVSKDFDERTRRLLELIDPNRKPGQETRTTKIVAVQVIPEEEKASAPAADEKNIVLQTVSLQGIENVPRVLLEGALIRFVVPDESPL